MCMNWQRCRKVLNGGGALRCNHAPTMDPKRPKLVLLLSPGNVRASAGKVGLFSCKDFCRYFIGAQRMRVCVSPVSHITQTSEDGIIIKASANMRPLQLLLWSLCRGKQSSVAGRRNVWPASASLLIIAALVHFQGSVSAWVTTALTLNPSLFL